MLPLLTLGSAWLLRPFFLGATRPLPLSLAACPLPGPWGASGQYPTYQPVPAYYCTWNTTRTEKVTKVRVLTSADGTPTLSEYVTTTDTESGNTPFPAPPKGVAAPTVEIPVEIESTDGPRLSAARITKGCNLEERPGRKCFGSTPAELRTQGTAEIAGGAVCLLLTVCCLAGLMRAAIKGD